MNFSFFLSFFSHLCNWFDTNDIQIWIAICGIHIVECLLVGGNYYLCPARWKNLKIYLKLIKTY